MFELLQKYIDENLAVENRMMSRGMGNYFYSEEEINRNNNQNNLKKIKPIFYDEVFDIEETTDDKELDKKRTSKKTFRLRDVFFDNEEEIAKQNEERKNPFEEMFNIHDYVQQKDDYSNFQTLLFKMIDDRNLKDSDVYNKVHMDRRLFSKLRNQDYHPSKDTVILLGLSLELSEKEIEELLDSASYSLPKNNHYDLIIRYCFIEGIYELKDVNELLASYNCREFSY